MIILNYFTYLISIILMLLKALPEKKREDLGKLENYRPVSILNCFSKIYNIIFFEKFKPWINSFLSEYMAAYRGNLSFDKIIHRNLEKSSWLNVPCRYGCYGFIKTSTFMLSPKIQLLSAILNVRKRK